MVNSNNNIHKIVQTVSRSYDSIITYPSVNKNSQLRKDVTDFFLKKILKWITTNDKYTHLKNKYEIYNSNKGEKLVYPLIRKFVNKKKLNWYELRTKYYSDVKAYLIQHI